MIGFLVRSNDKKDSKSRFRRYNLSQSIRLGPVHLSLSLTLFVFFSINMPLRLASLGDLPIISSIYAASFWDEEFVGGIMHPHRHEYPQDYADFWKRRVWENYWDYGHKLMVFYLDGGKKESGVNSENGKVDEAGLVVGIADWHRMGTGWEKVWGVWGWWDISRVLSPFSLYRRYHSFHMQGLLRWERARLGQQPNIFRFITNSYDLCVQCFWLAHIIIPLPYRKLNQTNYYLPQPHRVHYMAQLRC